MYQGGGGGDPGGGERGVGGGWQFRGPALGVHGHNQDPNQQGQGCVAQQGGRGSQQTMGPRPMGHPQMQQVSTVDGILWMMV